MLACFHLSMLATNAMYSRKSFRAAYLWVLNIGKPFHIDVDSCVSIKLGLRQKAFTYPVTYQFFLLELEELKRALFFCVKLGDVGILY